MVRVAAAAFITTINFFDSSDTPAALIALGLRIHPASRSTFSRTTNSCASRLAISGAIPPVSRRRISTFFPATVSPFFCMNSLMALSICAAVSANWPE